MADDAGSAPGVVNPVVFFDLALGGAWKDFKDFNPLPPNLVLEPSNSVANMSTERVRMDQFGLGQVLAYSSQ